VKDQLRIGDAAASASRETAATATPGETDESATDSGLVARIQSKFYQHDNLRRSNVAVAADSGVVTLSGTVTSEARKRDAVAVARNTDGVSEVRDELKVDASVPPLPDREATGGASEALVNASSAAADAWLTTKIQAAFYLDPDIKGGNIDVSTNQGVVTLTGEVASAAAGDQAKSIARDTDGVTRVIDTLTVAASPGRR
jgi:osmotically-inducible protein OsmY